MAGLPFQKISSCTNVDRKANDSISDLNELFFDFFFFQIEIVLESASTNIFWMKKIVSAIDSQQKQATEIFRLLAALRVGFTK